MLLELAKILDSALLETREVERLTAKVPDLKLDDAYRIQDEGIKFRLARGEKLIGLKMGLTSKAKREQMNLSSPVYGVLTDRMQQRDGEVFSLKGKIHPKIEPEIAFIIGKRELRGRVTAQQALEACSGICAAMEILDSRFVGFKYFSLPDVVADNSSSAYFVLSSKVHDPGKFDLASLAKLQMSMEVDGKPVQTAFSSEISGNPVNSIVQLCEILDSRGLVLPAGSIVLAGAATQAVQLVAGMKVCLRVPTLGEVSLVVA
ncbi:MAG: fumarylacetoacetate hydrolase family protein [Deltaproteobacteria bacterium]|nr:fumarylacetoacetate hydrolase family protein [Deltaproteobacteria bacterium]